MFTIGCRRFGCAASSFVIGVFVLSFAVPAGGGEVQVDQRREGGKQGKVETGRLKDAVQAKEYGLRLAGLKEDIAASAKLVTVESDETPFLGQRLNGREVWRVTVPNWSVELKSTPEEKDSYRRTLDILLDPDTGQVLKLKTRWPENVPVPQDTVEPDAATAERQILPEKYHGFPSELPPISFAEALESGEYWAHAALVAKCIEGIWVLHSHTDSEPPHPVWVIMLWGIPPIPVFHADADVPAYLRENIRFVVDPAKKEGWLVASQSPHRVPVKKEAQSKDKEQ